MIWLISKDPDMSHNDQKIKAQRREWIRSLVAEEDAKFVSAQFLLSDQTNVAVDQFE